MQRSAADFEDGIADASRSALLEVWLTLGEYNPAMVLLGGWAPYLIIESFRDAGDDFQHIGSIDIDIALNPKQIGDREYASIAQLLEKRGFQPRKDKNGNMIQFSFERDTRFHNESEMTVVIDFLAGEYGGTGKKRRHQQIQSDLNARKARGSDVVFDHNFNYELEATLPRGGRANALIQVADIVGCLTTKGMAIGSRYSEKDAYDVYAVISHYKSGVRDVIDDVRPHARNRLVREGLGNIAEKFSTIDSAGPAWVADFLNAKGDERDRLVADAFAQVHTVMEEALRDA